MTKRHARFYWSDRCFWVEDLGGEGVWVNGASVERQRLAHRDKVQVGTLAVEFFEN